MKQHIKQAICLLLAVLLIFHGTDMTAYASASKSVKKVTITINGKNYTGKTYSLKVGQTVKAKTVCSPNSAKKKISYQSSNKKIAKATAKGGITGVKAGTAKITVTVTGKDKKKKNTSMKVKVTDVAVKSITLEETEIVLRKGQSRKLNPVISPKNAAYQTVTYTSLNPETVMVNSDGTMTAIANGTATVIARAGNCMASCKIDVITDVSGVKLNSSNISIYPNEQVFLKATVIPSDASDQSVTYVSSDAEVAAVNESGEITAHKTGTAVITVRTQSGGFEAFCMVEVKKQTSDITIEQTAGSAAYDMEKNAYLFYAGDTGTFTAVSDTNAQLTVRSTDDDILKISEFSNGSFTVQGVKEGIAAVVVTSAEDRSDVSKSILIYVQTDDMLVREISQIRKTDDGNYEFFATVHKDSGRTIDEEEFLGSAITLRSDKYAFDAEYKDGSYDSGKETAVYRVGDMGQIVLDSGKGARTYQAESFTGGLADGSQNGTLETFYVELVEGIQFIKDGDMHTQSLYVGQEFQFQAKVENINATKQELNYSVLNQQPTQEQEDNQVVTLVQEDDKVTIKAVGAGTAEVCVTATDESDISETMYVQVDQDTVIVEPKTIGKIVKKTKDDKFYYTVSMIASLESGNIIDTSDSSPALATSIVLKKQGEETRSVRMHCEKCDPTADKHLGALTFSTDMYEADKNEYSATNPCPLVTKNNAATGIYELVSDSPANIVFEGYPDPDGTLYPTTVYRETATVQSIEGYAVNKKGDRLSGILISVGNNYSATTDSEGYYFIDLGTSKATSVTASDPTGHYWNAAYTGKMDVSAGNKVAVNFIMEEQDPKDIYIFGYVRGEINGVSAALGGAVVELQAQESEGDWKTIAAAVSSNESDRKGKYVFANNGAEIDGYAEDDALPEYIYRFANGDENRLSNDKMKNYRVVVKKEAAEDNLTDVYEEGTGEAKRLNTIQASTGMGDITLKRFPETYTNVNQDKAKEFQYLLAWDNDKYVSADSTDDKSSVKTAAYNATNHEDGSGDVTYQISLIAPDGSTLLKRAEYTDTIQSDAETKQSGMACARDLIFDGFFGKKGDIPTLPAGVYYFIVDDGINAYTVIPCVVAEDGHAVMDEEREIIRIPFTQKVNTTTYIESGSNSMKKLGEAQTSDSNLVRVTDEKNAVNATNQIETVVYGVYQEENGVNVYLRNSGTGATVSDGLQVSKDEQGISASHAVEITRLDQKRKYNLRLVGDMVLGEWDRQSGVFQEAAGNQLGFIKDGATGSGFVEYRVKGTADVNAVSIPVSAFDEIAGNSVLVENVTLKKAGTEIGIYEVEEKDKEVYAQSGSFLIPIPDTQSAFKKLKEGDDYSVQIAIRGYQTGYEESFQLIQFAETTVTYNYDENAGKDITNICYKRIEENYISGILTDTDGNSVVDNQSNTTDVYLYLYDEEKKLCGIESIGYGDINGDTKSFQFVDGINAVIRENGRYTVIVRCSMEGTGRRFQITQQEVAVSNGVSRNNEIKVMENQPGATISAVILQENPIQIADAYDYNVSLLPADAVVYAYEISDYYVKPKRDVADLKNEEYKDLTEDELYEKSKEYRAYIDQFISREMMAMYEDIVEDMERKGHTAGIGKYRMTQNAYDAIYWETEPEVAAAHYAIYAENRVNVVGTDAKVQEKTIGKTYYGDDSSAGFIEVSDSIGKYSYAFNLTQDTGKTDFMREITVSYNFLSDTADLGYYDMIVLYNADTRLPVAYYSNMEKGAEGDTAYRLATFNVYNVDAKYYAVIYHNGCYVGETSVLTYRYKETTKNPNDKGGNLSVSLAPCK